MIADQRALRLNIAQSDISQLGVYAGFTCPMTYHINAAYQGLSTDQATWLCRPIFKGQKLPPVLVVRCDPVRSSQTPTKLCPYVNATSAFAPKAHVTS